MKVWLNERLVDMKKARVSVFDHGFLYGDGIYETVRAYTYKVFHWDQHYQRLLNSARRIELRCPWSSRTLLERVQKVLRANRAPEGSVRITIARGPGPLGLDPSVCPHPTLVMLLFPPRPVEQYRAEGVSIGITAIRRNPRESLDPQIKSNNSLNTILAKMEAKKMGAFEGVLTNHAGTLTEGTTSNIFFVKKGMLYTPALSCGLLEGVSRGVVLKLARKHGLRVHEGRYTPRDLLRADEAFLTGTTIEVVPIVSIKIAGERGTHRVGKGRPGPIVRRLQALFRDVVCREMEN